MNLRLKIALFEQGVRQIEVSKGVNLDPSKFSKIVNGWIEAKPEERKAIAEFLGKPESEIFPAKREDRDAFLERWSKRLTHER